MLSLREMARALGGEVAGGQVLAPGPGHSARDRSVVIRPDPGSPGGVLVHSHAGDDWRAVKDHVLARLGITPDFARPSRPTPRTAPARPPEARSDPDATARTRRARELWAEAVDPRGTEVEVYLAGRALALDDAALGAIRYHPRCPFGQERHPAMVCAMRAVEGDALQAIHRTALTPGGTKLGRKMLGPAAGAAIKLDGDAEVAAGLVVGEGAETCLAARLLGYRPTWALGSVGAIRVLPVLPGIEALTILVESDDGGASEAAARVCAGRWHAAGRAVRLARPRAGGDMNDALRRARGL